MPRIDLLPKAHAVRQASAAQGSPIPRTGERAPPRRATAREAAPVFWSDEDEGHIAVVPDLPGVLDSGNTPEEAVREIGDATEAWIAACRAAGDPVPEPVAKARQAA